MDPDIWGPKLWFAMHTISLNYPSNPTEKDKKVNKIFFENLQHVIPCPTCQNHYSKFLKKNPVSKHLSNKMELTKWVLSVHNDVNIRNGKAPWDIDKLLKHYNSTYEGKKSNLKIVLFIILILILIPLGYYLFKNYTWVKK